jgi:hypothetical protein
MISAFSVLCNGGLLLLWHKISVLWSCVAIMVTIVNVARIHVEDDEGEIC